MDRVPNDAREVASTAAHLAYLLFVILKILLQASSERTHCGVLAISLDITTSSTRQVSAFCLFMFFFLFCISLLLHCALLLSSSCGHKRSFKSGVQVMAVGTTVLSIWMCYYISVVFTLYT